MNKKLIKISDLIIQSKTQNEINFCGEKLLSFYSDINDKNYSHKDKRLNCGLAISPNASKKCMEEYTRTVSFIKGVKRALDRIESGTIVYAGCGVYAPLLLTVLHYYKEDRFKITLIDSNKECIDSVKTVISELNYEKYNINLVCGDASLYKEKDVDILICECMFGGLINEPQIDIINNFNAKTIIPEKIIISASDYDYNNKKDLSEEIELCVISKENKKINESIVDSSNHKDTLCIHTKVIVFDDILIDRNESLITKTLPLSKRKENTKIKHINNALPHWISEYSN